MSTRRWPAVQAFRMRVSMSATGSVMLTRASLSPAGLAPAVLEDLEVRDVMVLGQDPRQLGLELGARDVDPPVARGAGVPDAGQHVGHGISHAHAGVPLTSWPCARRGCAPSARARGNRSGTVRTSGAPRAPARSAGTGGPAAWRTSECAWRARSSTSLP